MTSLRVLMLGRTVPEPTSDKSRQYVCSAGYSNELGLVRLYPVGLKTPLPKWSVVECEAERHPRNKDSRSETWKPISGETDTNGIRRKRAVQMNAVRVMCKRYMVSGRDEANERRMSLAIVSPNSARFVLEIGDGRDNDEAVYVSRLYSKGDPIKAKERFPYHPRVKLITDDGKEASWQYREWGVWELMRHRYREIAEMAHIDREQYVGNAIHLDKQPLFLIGNYAQYRNSWLIIATLPNPFL